MNSGTQRTKHVPQRTCVGCREILGKRDLVRVVSREGVEVDATGKKPGRGAYIHASRNCWGSAMGKGRLERALRTRLTPEDRQRLEEYVRNIKETEKSGC